MRNKKRNKYLLLLALLLLVTVGYALISTTLKINGTATVTKQTWNVYWGVPTVTEGSVTTTVPTRTQDSGDPANTKLVWTTTLDLPGDFYEFTVDAVNAGTIDVMITGINNTVTPTLPDYIKYDVTYADGVAIGENHLLAKQTGANPTTEKYKVRVYYDEAAATASTINNMTSDTQYTFTFNVTYGQADENATSKPLWILPQGKTASTLAVGDEICFSKDNTQCFNFIRYDNNDVVMLSKYNLNVGSNAKGTATNIQDSDVRGWMPSSTGMTTYGTVAFSTTNYWNGSVTYPADIYDAINYAGEPGTTNYSIAYYVEEYKDILETAGATIKDARLLTYSEATDTLGCNYVSCPTIGNKSFIRNTSFWLGCSDGIIDVWNISQDGLQENVGYNNDNKKGVRPVVVIDKANL